MKRFMKEDGADAEGGIDVARPMPGGWVGGFVPSSGCKTGRMEIEYDRMGILMRINNIKCLVLYPYYIFMYIYIIYIYIYIYLSLSRIYIYISIYTYI